MKKRIIASLIIVCTLFMPISSNAENNTIVENTKIVASEQNITLEYQKNEQKEIENLPVIGCKAAYVAEPTTGKILYEKNAHQKMYPASTTKILTALVVMEKCQMTDKVTVSKKALDMVPAGGSNAGLKQGEELSVSDMLYALLIPSANEAANALAEHVSGSVEEFAVLCNNRAKELGCENLHFTNANGLHDENHYCTAYDLYLIAKECQKYDVFNEIVKTKSYTLPATNVYSKKDRVLKNTNYLLFSNLKNYYYPYCTGIKTGHTTPAGECLVASSSYNNLELISVVLGGGTNSKGLNERFADTSQLFEFVYNNYAIKEVANKENAISHIKVKHGTKDTAELDVTLEKNISTIVPKDFNIENIKKSINIDEKISAPIKENQVIGQATIYVDGLQYTVNIIASHDVKKIPYWLNISIILLAMLLIFIIIKLIKKKI